MYWSATAKVTWTRHSTGEVVMDDESMVVAELGGAQRPISDVLGVSDVLGNVLVANRGEIASRIIRSVHALGARAVAVYSDADEALPYVKQADEAHHLGASPPTESYLDIDRLLAVAHQANVGTVHPGYGFLAESPAFARAVIAAGLRWVGPAPETMELMGDKINARRRMAAAGLPVAAGSDGAVATADDAVKAARVIGYPVMVKASAGGGGIGMGVAANDEQLRAAFETAQSRAARFFSSSAVFLERFVTRARHVEIQIFGAADGSVVALGERDCSVQRRHQKVIEETPSPGISAELRARMIDAAVRAGQEVGYRGAGTVECLVDVDAGDFVFLEMNTRLQVEHPVTECVTGVDLVAEQFLAAAGLPTATDLTAIRPAGHAIEMRIYAEDPKRFLPGPGAITEWVEPTGPGVRVDAGYASGTTVTPFYDPLLAKLIVHGVDRSEALARARSAVAEFTVTGPKCNLPFLAEVLDHPEFHSGRYDTGLVTRMRP
jgi:acetyl-CoA carboxylase, biotin carboxylase subunit